MTVKGLLILFDVIGIVFLINEIYQAYLLNLIAKDTRYLIYKLYPEEKPLNDL